MDGRPNLRNKAAFSNSSGVVWRGSVAWRLEETLGIISYRSNVYTSEDCRK